MRRTSSPDNTIDLSAISGLPMRLESRDLSLTFGEGLNQPEREIRRLEDIRPMLWQPDASGPEHLYSVYMGIGRAEDDSAIRSQGLVYGSMIFSPGLVGDEPIRSQGHLHAFAPGGLRYSEVFQFWTGEGYLYLQKEVGPDVTRALFVRVSPGDIVVLPGDWMHLVVNVGSEPLSFGAWAARDNQFEYGQLRALGGPAYFVMADGEIAPNPRYRSVAPVEIADPRDIPTLGIPADRPIYETWQADPHMLDFVADPELARVSWQTL
ncbi:MAG: hypothetical protein OES13_05765 [Acidimicrobiia bacterium]|nr:hypothetical protein [Acidimicrobiia bacterium]